MRKIATTGLIICISVLILALAGPLVVRYSMDTGHIKNTPIRIHSASLSNYPFVLHHGALPISTMHKFSRYLRKLGYNAYSTQVSACSGVADRARSLREQVEWVLVGTQAKKVNIIAHSMGGIDARYLISALGYEEKVASLTTVATPHRGTSFSERVLFWKSGLFFLVANYFAGAAFEQSNWFNVDIESCVKAMTPSAMERFNRKYKNSPRVYYQSYAGAVGEGTSLGVEPQNILTQKYIYQREGLNDGVVAVSSAKWGVFRKVLPAGHGRFVGWPAWLGGAPDFDPFVFYKKIVVGLVERGF